jgi:hypothetical protein
MKKVITRIRINLFSFLSFPPFLQQVRVKVLDKNDSPPTFRDLPLVFSVSEDLGPGQTVATIRATDPDTIGKLEYAIVSGGDSKFVLEKETGVLKLRDTLDREVKETYKLLVRVADGEQNTETMVTIQVSFRSLFYFYLYFGLSFLNDFQKIRSYNDLVGNGAPTLDPTTD